MTIRGRVAGSGQLERAALDQVLSDRALRVVYQPLVDLDSGEVAGFEALVRGPRGTPLSGADSLFDAARRAGRLADLDLACREAALLGASVAGLAAPYRLFVNAEPEVSASWQPPRLTGAAPVASEQAVIVPILELTERALTARPAQLLHAVAGARAAGWGIALDDVGADPASLALLPVLRPDVIKLDLRVVQQRPGPLLAAVVNAVHAEAERSGAVVLAEGLETEEHVQTARAYGATLGQGWLFGRPGPLPAPIPPFRARQIRITRREEREPGISPFEVGAALRAPRHGTKALLIEVSKQLEAQALAAGNFVLVLTAFQDVRYFTPATRRRYSRLAAEAAFVGALGVGMPPAPAPRVRGAILDRDDQLRGEWIVAVLGPHFSATLVARDLGDPGPERSRRFDFVLSHDRELCAAVAHCLLSRI